nr:MAG TPA: hypothetical protein [Caudoviricetes sp.]
MLEGSGKARFNKENLGLDSTARHLLGLQIQACGTDFNNLNSTIVESIVVILDDTVNHFAILFFCKFSLRHTFRGQFLTQGIFCNTTDFLLNRVRGGDTSNPELVTSNVFVDDFLAYFLSFFNFRSNVVADVFRQNLIHNSGFVVRQDVACSERLRTSERFVCNREILSRCFGCKVYHSFILSVVMS